MRTRDIGLVGILTVALAGLGMGQMKPMTNGDVTALAAAGIGDDLIVEKIHAAAATNFDTGLDGLKALQAAHVSSVVVRAMINPHAAGTPVATGGAMSQYTAAMANAGSNDPAVMHPQGIYLYSASAQGKELKLLENAKLKQIKSRGVGVSALTQGIYKAKLLTVVEGSAAPVSTTEQSPTFYLYVPGQALSGGLGLHARDFVLVQMQPKGDTRELQTGTMSTWSGHDASTDEKAKRGFTIDEVSAGIYKFTLVEALQPGQYAFMPGQGRLYDFAIAPK